MSFKIVVTEISTELAEIERYHQLVEELDLAKLIAVVNGKPRVARKPRTTGTNKARPLADAAPRPVDYGRAD